MPSITTDIVIVGAGLAGAAAAAVLGQQGWRIVLVDPRPSYPHVFKAEKVDTEQVQLLRKFGLLGHMLPYAGTVREVQVAYDGRVFGRIPIEQYGISYPDMVNALRSHLPATVEFRVGRGEAIANSDECQRVRLSGGQELVSRLVVLASGINDGLQSQLNVRRRLFRKNQSFVFGFNIDARDSHRFDFDSVTYYSIDPSTCIDYLTFFRIRETMRANLFVFRDPTDPWVRSFLREPDLMLRQELPKLSRVTGEFHVTGKVESGGANLYRLEGEPPPGVAVIGDSFQSVCPSTGMGLDKVLTDVDALAECVPQWWATPGMGAAKLADFYNHARKRAMDLRALRSAHYHRRIAMDPALRWRAHRTLLHLKWRLTGAIRTFTDPSNNSCQVLT